MEPILAYLLDNAPVLGLIAFLLYVCWVLKGWQSDMEHRVKTLETALADHDAECAIRTARIHERLDAISDGLAYLRGRMDEKASDKPLTDSGGPQQG